MGEPQSALLLRKQLAGKNLLEHSSLELFSFATHLGLLEFPLICISDIRYRLVAKSLSVGSCAYVNFNRGKPQRLT